jgi:PhnB protein
MKVQTYLAFDGDCQEALNFYGDLFDAKITNRVTYEDKKIDLSENYRKKLQHAELKGKDIHIMAYDATPDTPLSHGFKHHLSIDVHDSSKAKELFNTLAKDGQVHHEFKTREWGEFGRCTDKFGVNWMVNCN